MLYILVTFIGAIIGIILMALVSVEDINEKQSLIDASRKALADAEEKITERNELIKEQRKQIKELEVKITDLKNNIELLVNNSENKKLKELVTDGKSEN